MSKFGHLKQRTPAGKVQRYYPPIKGVQHPPDEEHPEGRYVPACLFVRIAGKANPGWHNAVLKHNARTGVAKRAAAAASSDSDDPAISKMLRDRDAELYPEHIIEGWEGIPDGNGKEVPFTKANAREYLEAISDFLFTDLRVFCLNEVNFLGDSEPMPDEVRATAGN
jgi:hypothetical protein